MRDEGRAIGAPAVGMVKLTQEAIGFTDFDVMQRKGLISRDVPGRVMGIEAAGTVTAVGPGMDDFTVGDRVGYLRSQSQASRYPCRAACTVVPPDRDRLPFHAHRVPVDPSRFPTCEQSCGCRLPVIPSMLETMTMAVVVQDAAAVLGFWFGEVPPDKRFAKDQALDRVIEERFGARREAVLASDADGWRDDPNRLLAAIILLDQFSRNILRGSGRAFVADPLARSLTLQALDRGWEGRYGHEQLRFLYLPLAHAEDIALQALSVDRYEALGDPEALKAAREHAEVIRLHGRFPSRNAALARPSTPAEISYLRKRTHRW